MPQNIKQHIKQQFEEVRRKRQERIAKAVGWEKKLLLGIAECKDIDWHIDLIKQTLQALAKKMMEEIGEDEEYPPLNEISRNTKATIIQGKNLAKSEIRSAQQVVAKKYGLNS